MLRPTIIRISWSWSISETCRLPTNIPSRRTVTVSQRSKISSSRWEM